MITTQDFRKGMAIKVADTLFIILDFQHVKPGKGKAFVRTKLKNLKSGAIIDHTFRAGEKVEDVRLEEKPVVYLYKDRDVYHFMDKETYEEITLSAAEVSDAIKYLIENAEVTILSADNKPVSVKLPKFVELKVVETKPGLRGDTVSGGSKPAKLETGTVVSVPLFIEAGDILKIDTETGEYVERVKK